MADPLLETIRGGLVVSCQAYPGEPLRDPHITRQTALAVAAGGAVAVRVQGIEDIEQTVPALSIPVIGIWKDGADGVVITPTLRHARAVADAGAAIIGLDGTRRPRPDGRSLADVVAALKAAGEVLVMADCGSVDDALTAEDAGADIIGTTLAGYTGERPVTAGPDLDLVHAVVQRCARPVMAEGRFRDPDDVRAAFAAGAHSVCVGTAITHPTSIARAFVEQLPGQRSV